MKIFKKSFQEKFKDHLIFDEKVFDRIDPKVKLHEEVKKHPLSSAAACLNVLGSLGEKPEELKNYMNHFGLNIDRLIEFPFGAQVGDRIYNDRGYVVFEWIGPHKSPINEKGGGRGQSRTSIDAYILAEIDNKVTQILIEWKLAEGIFWPFKTFLFSGKMGTERLCRYSNALRKLRHSNEFPFNFGEEKGMGLFDFGVDHLYQLMRITLLAKLTTPIKIGKIEVEDYRIMHLTHSQNEETAILKDEHLTQSPGMQKYVGQKLYEAWKDILSESERRKFFGGKWDYGIKKITFNELKNYLQKRYVG